MQLLPPHPSKCQACAWEHLETEPHNAQTLYYHFWFEAKYNRPPTWADAMEHCSEEVQQKWLAHFNKLEVDIYSTNLTGNLKSESEVEERMKR